MQDFVAICIEFLSEFLDEKLFTLGLMFLFINHTFRSLFSPAFLVVFDSGKLRKQSRTEHFIQCMGIDSSRSEESFFIHFCIALLMEEEEETALNDTQFRNTDQAIVLGTERNQCFWREKKGERGEKKAKKLWLPSLHKDRAKFRS